MSVTLHGSDPFRSFWDLASLPRQEQQAMLGSTDIVETDKELVFKSDAPGMTKEDIKIHVSDGRVLCISGERKSEHKEATDKFHRVERSFGKFTRQFRLPDTVDVSKIAAKVENGGLTVIIPKLTTPVAKKFDVLVE
jgi:HSP20 family protein